MYFKKKSNVIFRNYGDFGYITDNRNFGYNQTNDDENVIGDKILSDSGAVFMSVLDRKPQAIDELTKKIAKHFTDVDINTVMNDAFEFYSMLEKEGFVLSGETVLECDKKDTRFSYKTLDNESKGKVCSPFGHQDKTTQDFFEEYFNGESQLTNVHIEISSKCNESCMHCYIPQQNKVSYMEPDLFYEVLRQCSEMRVIHITLSGGEPMMHKNFCDFLKKCNENEFSVNVLSNLTLLDDEIVRVMKMNPLLGVQASLYSMNPSIHDGITQMKGSFEKTKKAILKLVENDIPLQISCPIIKQNKDCYGEVIKWAGLHKIHVGDDYGIIARYDHVTQNLSCRLSIDEIKDVIKDKIVNDSKYLGQIEMAAERKRNITSSDFVCSVCNSSICIADNGNVYPCAGWQSYVVGNVKKTSLINIWDKSEKVQYLRGLRNQDFPICTQCSDKEFCTMCMVRNANENPLGDPLAVNEFFCNIAKLNKEFVIEWREKL